MTKCCSASATHRPLMVAGNIIDALSSERITYLNRMKINKRLCSRNNLSHPEEDGEIPSHQSLTSCSPPVGGSVPSLEPTRNLSNVWGLFFTGLCDPRSLALLVELTRSMATRWQILLMQISYSTFVLL